MWPIPGPPVPIPTPKPVNFIMLKVLFINQGQERVFATEIPPNDLHKVQYIHG